MDTEKIKKGDVVKLKSGGPLMTADETNGKNVHCLWFDGLMVCNEVFDRASLQKSDPEKKHKKDKS
jgi:uncharacterized protein YodC (DUF2158 family)